MDGPLPQNTRAGTRRQGRERIVFWCRPCQHEADATFANRRWRIGGFSDRCPGEAACLAGIAQWLGCRPYQLLENPEPWLRSVAHEPICGPTRAAPLPTIGHIGGWQSRLQTAPGALNYLLSRVNSETVERYEFGWDGEALTLPIYEDGELVNLRRRRLGRRRPFKGLAGRGSQLFPPPPRRKAVLLVAGEFDALRAREHDLPAVTTTCGARLPSRLVRQLSTRHVAVAYDVGEEAAAEKTVAALRAAGSTAWLVRLGLLGLRVRGDLSDYFTKGGSRDELVRLIKAERSRR
jgi:hypothetical protein